MNRCDQCGNYFMPSKHTTGYAVDKLGNKICFKCCGENDSKELANALIGERFTFYLTNNEIINWPGTLRIRAHYIKGSRHNWGLKRTDVWFAHKGNNFHGYSIGHMTQILHVKRIK